MANAEKRYTKDFTGKTPQQIASIMKAEDGGVKRDTELRIWPNLIQARDAEDKVTVAVWVEVIQCLAEGSEDPKVPDVEPWATPATPPQLSIA